MILTSYFPYIYYMSLYTFMKYTGSGPNNQMIVKIRNDFRAEFDKPVQGSGVPEYFVGRCFSQISGTFLWACLKYWRSL